MLGICVGPRQENLALGAIISAARWRAIYARMAVNMLTLALDTSTRTGSVAILRDSHTLGVLSTSTDEAYSSRLFRQLDFLFGELALSPADCDLFAVCAGPGSFTGLRASLVATKAWAEVYRKPIAAISGLEAVAAQCPSHERSVLLPVVDARRGQIYAGVYRRTATGLARTGDERAASAAEFLESLAAERYVAADAVFVTPDPEVLLAALAASAFAIAPVVQVSAVLAPIIGRLGYACALRGKLTDALHLDANYNRRCDAEVSWKEQ
jgi:tRNA threonylcarbamoyladenosine biosynthesis protein TsaB